MKSIFSIFSLWTFLCCTVFYANALELVVQTGHTQQVTSVAFSPDDRFIVSGSRDGTVKIWDVANEALVRLFSPGTGTIWSAEWSPDGRFLAAGAEDSTIYIWDAVRGILVKELSCSAQMAISVSYHPDGRFIAAGYGDGTIRIWNTITGTLSHTLRGHEDTVSAVVYSPRGKYLASSSIDKTVRLWDAQTGRLVKTLTGHEGTVMDISFSRDGKHLASCSFDGQLRVWDVVNKKIFRSIHSIVGKNLYWTLDFSADGKNIALGSSKEDSMSSLYLIDYRRDDPFYSQTYDFSKKRTTRKHYPILHSVDYSSNGKLIAVGTGDGSVTVLDAANFQAVKEFQYTSKAVSSVVFSPCEREIAFVKDGTIFTLNPSEGLVTRKVKNASFSTLDYHPDGLLIAGAGDALSYGVAVLLNSEDSNSSQTFRMSYFSLRDLVFMASGKGFLCVSEDNEVHYFDLEEKKPNVVQRSEYIVSAVAVKPDDQRMMLASSTLKGGVLSGTISVCYDHTGDRVAMGNTDGSIDVLDSDSMDTLCKMKAGTAAVNSLTFSPDSRYIVSGSGDCRVTLWDSTTGEVVRVFSGHTAPVESVSYSHDGKFIVSGSRDGSVRIWNISNGRYLIILASEDHEKTILASDNGLIATETSPSKTLAFVRGLSLKYPQKDGQLNEMVSYIGWE